MALTLTSGISATDRTIAITGTVPDDIEAGYEFRLDDEKLTLTTFALHTVQYPGWTQQDPNRNSWMVRRGVAVSHDAGTAVKAAVDAFVSAADDDPPPTPFAEAGGGGGVGFYAQDTDPGAVGAGSVWKDTSTGTWWERNPADDGWIASFSPQATATGSDPANAYGTAFSVDGTASTGPFAAATGSGAANAQPQANSVDGAASAGPTAAATGTGAADAHSQADSVDGSASAGSDANATGTGAALAEATADATGSGQASVTGIATANTGPARAGSYASRQGVFAGMYSEVNVSGVALLGFNAVADAGGIAIPEIEAVTATPEAIVNILHALGLTTEPAP